jgi:hypothetical protein
MMMILIGDDEASFLMRNRASRARAGASPEWTTPVVIVKREAGLGQLQ